MLGEVSGHARVLENERLELSLDDRERRRGREGLRDGVADEELR